MWGEMKEQATGYRLQKRPTGYSLIGPLKVNFWKWRYTGCCNDARSCTNSEDWISKCHFWWEFCVLLTIVFFLHAFSLDFFHPEKNIFSGIQRGGSFLLLIGSIKNGWLFRKGLWKFQKMWLKSNVFLSRTGYRRQATTGYKGIIGLW